MLNLVYGGSPKAKFPFPFLDLTGTGTWPRACQLSSFHKGLFNLLLQALDLQHAARPLQDLQD